VIVACGAADENPPHALPLWRTPARRIGWKLLKLDKTHQTAELMVPGMQLDPRGIAKGYAADEAIRVSAIPRHRRPVQKPAATSS
jgi:thiamine biosynthesis lipoprotein ApbE